MNLDKLVDLAQFKKPFLLLFWYVGYLCYDCRMQNYTTMKLRFVKYLDSNTLTA